MKTLCKLQQIASLYISLCMKVTASQMYKGESNENLKYFLSRNLLNTEGTQ